jgi:putative FmdB family regulatory protein
MPLYEFRCKKCGSITEALIRHIDSSDETVNCAHCGSAAMSKVISLVRFKVARRAKYSDEFLDKATPFLKTQRETAKYFAEGKGSEDAKTFKLAEQIGERIDRTLASVPARKD